MKTKQQKQEELAKGGDFFGESQAVLLVDFSNVGAVDIRNLRKELKSSGSKLFVMKKRILNMLFRNKGIDYTAKDMKTSVAAVFAGNLEAAAGAVYKFFAGLEKEKKIEGQKILGGYDVKANQALDAARVVMIGKLPPREALLGQLLGMLAAPIRSFLYVLDQKSKQSGAQPAIAAEEAPAPEAAAPAAEPAAQS